MESLIKAEPTAMQMTLQRESNMICKQEKLGQWAVPLMKEAYLIRGLSYKSEDDINIKAKLFVGMLREKYPNLTTDEISKMIRQDNYGEGSSNTVSPASLIASLKRQGADEKNLLNMKYLSAAKMQNDVMALPAAKRTEEDMVQILKNDFRRWKESGYKSVYNMFGENYKLVRNRYHYVLTDAEEEALRAEAKDRTCQDKSTRFISARMIAKNFQSHQSYADVVYQQLVIRKFFIDVMEGKQEIY